MARNRFFVTFVAVCLVGTCASLPSSAQDDHGRPPITPVNAANVVLLGTAGSEPISDMIWSPDGHTLAVSTTSQVQLLDSTDLRHPAITLRDSAWNQVKDFSTAHTAAGGGDLAYTPDGGTLIVGHDPWLDFWNLQTNSLQGVYVSGDLGTERFAYDAEHATLIAGGNNRNTITLVLDSVTGITSMGNPIDLFGSRNGLTRSWLQRGTCVSDIALSPDKQYVAVASAIDPDCPNNYLPDTYPVTPEVRVWSMARVKLWQIAYKYLLNMFTWTGPSPDLTLSGHTQPVRQIIFSPDGSLIASAGLDGTARVWSMPDGKPYAVLRGHLLAVWDVDFSPDGTRVVSAGQDGTLRVWDVETGNLLRVIGGTGVALTLVVFSPDGTRIASAGQDGSVWIFDANTGDLLDSRPGQRPMWGVAFSQDGQTIVTGNDANEVVLWDVHPAEPTATIRQTLHGHTGPVYDVAFSPDGTLLASASSDHTVRLWNTQSGVEIAVLEGHTAAVYGVAFSPDALSWPLAVGIALRACGMSRPEKQSTYSAARALSSVWPSVPMAACWPTGICTCGMWPTSAR